MSESREFDLDDRNRCYILCVRQPPPTPKHLRDASLQILGKVYKETHYPDLSADSVVLATNLGLWLEQQYLQGRRIDGIACSLEPRARQALIAILAGIRSLRTDFAPPLHYGSMLLSPWNSEHVSEMIREADVRIDAERDREDSIALPDYEETIFFKRKELRLERIMIDTYDMMSRAIRQITSEYCPGIYLVVGHAPNLSILGCGKFRDGGRDSLWDALSVEQHIRVLGDSPVPGSNPPKFRTLQPCEGFWYMVDSAAEWQGLIPVRHTPGISMIHAESMRLQSRRRQAFIQGKLLPARVHKKS